MYKDKGKDKGKEKINFRKEKVAKTTTSFVIRDDLMKQLKDILKRYNGENITSLLEKFIQLGILKIGEMEVEEEEKDRLKKERLRRTKNLIIK